MKKIITLGLFLIVSFCLIGCQQAENSCKHKPTLVSCITEPTEQASGKGVFVCSICNEQYEGEIPLLSNKNYLVTLNGATCFSAESRVYKSTQFGTYNVETGVKAPHYSYGGYCMECEEVVNNLYYEPENFVQVSGVGGYPRLYILADGTWLCGFDTGRIQVARSEDEGKTWSAPVVASVHDDYACANVAFYQFPNGDILCAYRALPGGNSTDPYGRYIQCTISKDNGKTWSFHSTIESNYQTGADLGYTKAQVESAVKSEGRVGFFEPHFGIINGELTVMYADDFTTMLVNPRGSVWANYETQYIVSRSWNETTQKWNARKIVLDGTKQKQVGAIYDFSRDGMPVFDKLSDGTYVLVVEGTYRRTAARGNNPFIILLSYSKDGINWSTPVEVYVPKGPGTKASAPYVCVTSDDRLVISFQTDEDSYAGGRGTGDGVSMMKTIISDGTPVDKLTKENFSESVNVFGLRPGDLSSWNGMYMHEDTLYCVSGVKGSNEQLGGMGGVYIASSPIPTLEHVSTYDDKEVTESNISYTVRNGSVTPLESTWLRAKQDSTLITINDMSLENGYYSADVIPYFNSLAQSSSERNDCGIIFKVSSTTDKYWEKSSSYYVLLINYQGDLLLGKVNNGNWTLLENNNSLMASYSRLNRYNLMVEFNDGNICCYVNGEAMIEYYDANPLTGTGVGFRASKAKTLFNNPVIE